MGYITLDEADNFRAKIQSKGKNFVGGVAVVWGKDKRAWNEIAGKIISVNIKSGSIIMVPFSTFISAYSHERRQETPKESLNHEQAITESYRDHVEAGRKANVLITATQALDTPVTKAEDGEVRTVTRIVRTTNVLIKVLTIVNGTFLIFSKLELVERNSDVTHRVGVFVAMKNYEVFFLVAQDHIVSSTLVWNKGA